MGGHARHRQAFGGLGVVQLIFAAFQSGSAMIAWRPDFVERRCSAPNGARRRRSAPPRARIRIGSGPLQRLHAAHRTADHRQQLVDAQMLDQPFLAPAPCRDGDQGKFRP
jgi:hypothetical protein